MPHSYTAGGTAPVVGPTPDRAGSSALGARLIELRRRIDRDEAEFSRCLRRFTELRGYEADGSPSIVSWLRSRVGMSSGGSAQRAEIAEKLPDIPGADGLFESGAISFAHAAALARTAGDLGPEAARIAAPQLLDSARRLDPDRLRLVGRHLRHCVDPDGALADAIRAHQRRNLHVSQTLDGVFLLDGLLDAEGGALLKTAVDALAKPTPGDDRTVAQRRADALVELATRQLQQGDLPSSHGQRPHLVVTVPIETLRRESGAPAAEVNGDGVLPADAARRVACDAAVTEIVVSDEGEPIAVSRETRTIPSATRRAVEARDRTCRFPGCDRPMGWTDVHHLRHRADGGKNRLRNLVLLCRWHHTWVHEHRWKLRRSPDGELEAQPP